MSDVGAVKLELSALVATGERSEPTVEDAIDIGARHGLDVVQSVAVWSEYLTIKRDFDARFDRVRAVLAEATRSPEAPA